MLARALLQVARTTHISTEIPMRLAPATLLLLLAVPAAAAGHVLTLDPSQARVTFLLKATGHDVEGSFPLKRCDVRFDPATGSASGEIALDAAQGVTGNPKRDRTMREKVLLTAQSPEITFRPQKFVGTLPDSGPADVTLEGVANVGGVDHPLVLAGRVERTPGGLHLVSSFDIPFVQWGLKDPSVMFLKVEKVVHLRIEGDAVLAPDAPAASGR
jgi:polyisoprenoid-binding protein YceI